MAVDKFDDARVLLISSQFDSGFELAVLLAFESSSGLPPRIICARKFSLSAFFVTSLQFRRCFC